MRTPSKYRGIEHEIEMSIQWLIEQCGLPLISDQAAANILPKTANLLLPCYTLGCYRDRLNDRIPSARLSTALWYFWRMAYKWKSRNRVWPKTMEINFCSLENKQDYGRDRRGSICMVISMATYSSTAMKLAELFAESGYSFHVLMSANLVETMQECFPAETCVEAFESYLTAEICQQYEQTVESVAEDYPRILKQIRTAGPWLLKDLSRVCPEQLKYVTTEVMPQLLVYYQLAESVLYRLAPRVLLVTRLKRFTENTFTAVAKQSGIPVLLVNHGHIDRQWNSFELGKVDERCDAVFAWNEIQKQIWLELFPALETERVRVVGGIQWDKPVRRFKGSDEVSRMKAKRAIADALGKIDGYRVDPGRMWLTLTVDDHLRMNLAEVVETALQVSNTHVLIKTRPAENVADYRQLAEQFGEGISIISREVPVDLFELLHASDLVLTCVSTTNLDALAVGTPVLTLALNPKVRDDGRAIPLMELGLPFVEQLEELERVLTNWSQNTEYRQRLRRVAREAVQHLLANYPEGNAALQILTEIDKLAQDRPKCR